MRRGAGFLCIFFLIIFLSLPAGAFISGDMRAHLGFDTVSGQVEQSSLEEGFHYTVDLSLYLSGFLESGWDYFSSVDLRKSTDLLLEREDDLQLKRFLLALNQGPNEIRLGDLYTDLGRYYFNQRYRGLLINYELGPTQLRGLLGERHPSEEGVRHARYNYGLRLDMPLIFHDPTIISLVTTTTFDDPSSLPHSIADPITNSAHGILLQTRLQQLFFQSSLSYSYYEEGREKSAGESLFLQGDYQWNQVQLSASFEYVSPSFVSLGGALVSDRQTMNLRLRARIIEPLDMDLRYTQFHNNLNNQLEETTIQQAPRLQLTLSPPSLPGLRITGWAAGINKISTAETMHQEDLTLGLRLVSRIQLFTLEAGVEQRYMWDRKEPMKDEEATSYTASLRGRYPFLNSILQPGLLFTLKEERREEETILSPLLQGEMGFSRDSFTARLSYGERYREVDGIRDGGRKTGSFLVGYQLSEMIYLELQLSHTQQMFSDVTNNYEDTRASLTYRYRF